MRAFLGLGGNLPDSQRTLQTAAALLRLDADVPAISSLYRSAARDREDQADFLNAACAIETSLEGKELLDWLKRLERQLGRDSGGERWGPRLIDLDILAIEGACLGEPDLRIPHPRLDERRFALEPLAELAPELKPWAACIGDRKQDLTVREALQAVLDQRVERIAGPQWASEADPD